MSAKILIVEDEPLIANSVAYALKREGFETEIAGDGLAALEAARARPADLVILDLILPGLSGMDVAVRLRQQTTVPIIMLTARDRDVDKALGFERGADDYVVKPFSMIELIARVRAQLRRRELDRAGTPAAVRRVGGVEIDLARHTVTVDAAPVRLTPSEYEILALLTERPDEVFDRREIVSRLWSSDYVGDMRACDSHIARLRRKIERDPDNPERIVSVRGVGYKIAPVG
jgi:two-component system response regulator RegX3